ncbi:MFS transporter [Streptomyces venezuelae]|uniref:MFS transporter n=3 Tax=Streptomyces TaxID=1883 RepID=A0A5P2BDL8_STRVZ|nr:MFS transporter [Streptomyces sp. SID335]MYZ14914.1 MFS transporter [Streptomyces sp. SID337]NEB49512.1 MFS transporter [Streptomyces sp. SID339]QES27838.1 MFS transporter [Streptomyces venezuelae]
MGYSAVRSWGVVRWGFVAVGARMPVAAAPLALVFLVRERPGGYVLGAALAAAYVVGEIVGAPVLGMRIRAERARGAMAVGLGVGGLAFAGLGVLHGAHPLALGACAFVAGAAPAAAPGALRALLTSIVPEAAVAQALAVESMLTFAVWAVAPAAVTGLALGVSPVLPLLLGGLLMTASVAGLWMLPAGWRADADDRGGESMVRILARAWPLFVTGAASLSMLALAELVLPALLEQRGIDVGWAGPLLVALAVGSAVGSFVYGLRRWPGRLRTQSMVLMFGVSGCLALVALLPGVAWLFVALAVAGVLQAGVMLTRNLSLREALPPSALAAGYSVMYAAVGAGYAASGSLAGGLLSVVSPSTAILSGVGLGLVLTLVGVAGEVKPAAAEDGAAGSGGRDVAERPPVGRRRDS